MTDKTAAENNSQANGKIGKDAFAAAQARDVMAAFKAAPDDIAAHKQRLLDLKYSICRRAAEAQDADPDSPLVWNLADNLPDFAVDTLYQTRASFLSLAVAVFLGWLAGGLLATLLGFLGLGGEIWRPLAIFGALWLEQYLGCNPRARRILLAVLGLGALGRFAAALASGMVRFSGVGGIRQLVFGAGTKPGIFRAAWLWFGAFFLYVFFAKKITGLDLDGFEENLERQIGQRYELADMVLEDVNAARAALATATNGGNSGVYCPRSDCVLAQAAVSLLDSLDSDKRRYLTSSLARAGHAVKDADQDRLIWDQDAYGDLYEPVGLVRDGDPCLILSRPYEDAGKPVKGRVQRL